MVATKPGSDDFRGVVCAPPAKKPDPISTQCHAHVYTPPLLLVNAPVSQSLQEYVIGAVDVYRKCEIACFFRALQCCHVVHVARKAIHNHAHALHQPTVAAN